MTRVALDSNILIYAELEPDSEKGTRSTDLILRAARDGVIPVPEDEVRGAFEAILETTHEAHKPQGGSPARETENHAGGEG